MKITWLKGDLSSHKLIQIDKVVKLIKEKPPTQALITFRQDLQGISRTSYPENTGKFPAVIFSSGYKEGVWIHYTGLILIEFNFLPSLETACRLKQEIITYKQPFLCFTGISGRSVKVITRYTLPDGTLPDNQTDAKLFHEVAYRQSVLHYQEQFRYPVTLKEPTFKKTCRISSDPDCFYHPDALPVRLPMPDRLPDEREFRKYPSILEDPFTGMLPGYDQYKKAQFLFETCLDQTFAEKGKTWDETDEKSFLTVLANYCLRSAIPEEDTVRWMYMRYVVNAPLELIRVTVRNIYQQKKMFGSKPCLPRPTDVVLRIKDFLERRFEFRKNEVSEQVEFRQRNSVSFHFRPLKPENINDIVLEARLEGIDAWNRDIERSIFSASLDTYHPVLAYLDNLPQWDGKDRIRELARRVPTSHPLWIPLFYKWFTGMVAQWKKPNNLYGNSLVPVLTGGQGIRKSTFYRMLIPKELQEYYIENITLDNRRDAELKMAQHVLIVLDEFDRLNKKHQAELKQLIQLPVLKVKKPYRKTYEIIPRLASFAANANPPELLTDPTGSRRYLCVEVQGVIDISTPILHEQVYAQALHAIKGKEIYWLTPEEEKQMQEINLNFQQLPLEMQYVFTYFRLPEPDEPAGSYYAVEIWEVISHRSGQKFSLSSAKRFSHMLTGAGIRFERIRGKNKYFLIEK